MAKKDSWYFENLSACADYAVEAAELLSKIMHNYDPANVDKYISDMHEIEQASDDKRHELCDVLVTAFITPIEREDLSQLSSNLDDVVDTIESVLHRLYYNNVTETTPGGLEMVELLVKAVHEMHDLIDEMPNFKKPKQLHEHVIKINDVESQADEVFVRIMRDLHTNEKDALKVLSRREIYMYLEYSIDACEHVGDLADTIVMQNS